MDVQGLVDGFVRDSHGLILRELDSQPARDLLRAPCQRPAPVLAATVTPPGPWYLRAGHYAALWSLYPPGKPLLHVLAQRLVRSEFRGLGALGPPLGMPLRCRGTILQPAATRGGVAAQLSGDRSRVAADPAGNVSNAAVLRLEQGNLLSLSQRQVTPRDRGQVDRRHAPILAEPPRPDRWRHAAFHGGVLTLQAAGDRLPEPLPIFPVRHSRPARRAHRLTDGPIRHASSIALSHSNSSSSRCCDDPLNPGRHFAIFWQIP